MRTFIVLFCSVLAFCFTACAGQDIRDGFAGQQSFDSVDGLEPQTKEESPAALDTEEHPAARDVVVFPQLGHSDSITSVAYSPDGRHIVSGSSDKTVRIWDVETGLELRTLSGHTDGVISSAFSPDGKYIVSGSTDNTVKLWDTESGREIRTLSGHIRGG